VGSEPDAMRWSFGCYNHTREVPGVTHNQSSGKKNKHNCTRVGSK
jgi:hypothetical protein